MYVTVRFSQQVVRHQLVHLCCPPVPLNWFPPAHEHPVHYRRRWLAQRSRCLLLHCLTCLSLHFRSRKCKLDYCTSACRPARARHLVRRHLDTQGQRRRRWQSCISHLLGHQASIAGQLTGERAQRQQITNTRVSKSGWAAVALAPGTNTTCRTREGHLQNARTCFRSGGRALGRISSLFCVVLVVLATFLVKSSLHLPPRVHIGWTLGPCIEKLRPCTPGIRFAQAEGHAPHRSVPLKNAQPITANQRRC